MRTISTVQAAKIIGSSVKGVHLFWNAGRLQGVKRKQGKRVVLRLYAASVREFADLNRDNKRIGRELYCREVRRNPYVNRGYRLVYQPNHPNCYHDGYIPEHVLVVEASLGRYLKKPECVHHVNGDRLDNRIENLTLFSSQSEHMREAHNQLRQFLLNQKAPQA